MTVATHDPGPGEVSRAPARPAPSSDLQQFAADADAVYRIALSIAPTDFVPMSYKLGRGGRMREVEEIAAHVSASWLAGAEVGLRPMQSLQAIDVIEGRPALNARSQRALVQAHGHEIWVEEQSPEKVVVRGRREGSAHTEESVWTLARARQAGLLSKKNWQSHPQPMMVARGTSEVCRLIAADVLLGLAYTAEELEDGVEGAETAVTVERVRRPAPEVVAAAVSAGLASAERANAAPISQEQQPQEPDEPAPAADPPSAPEPEMSEGEYCQQRKASDPTKACSRPDDHEGRHHFGRTVELPEPEPIADPETSEPALREGIEDPERPAVGEFEPTPEERAEQDEPLYDEPSEEEQARAAEADLEEQRALAQRQADEVRARRAPRSVADVPLLEDPPEDPPGDADEPADDPWADFGAEQ